MYTPLRVFSRSVIIPCLADLAVGRIRFHESSIMVTHYERDQGEHSIFGL
jgi:hypothetical protein